MRENFKRDKMRRESLRKKKQEEKRNKRLNKQEKSTPPDQAGSVNSAETSPSI